MAPEGQNVVSNEQIDPDRGHFHPTFFFFSVGKFDTFMICFKKLQFVFAP